MEHDIGFLPGSLEEKMAEFSGSVYDSFDVIMGENKKINIDMLFDSGTIEIVPQTYMRGRSLKDTIVCVEEAQNLSPHSIKTLCTRLSDNSRIFMTGDLQQIDNGKLDWHSSGLRHVIEAFADQPLAAHITLQKGERSSFADIASEIL
jgi:PhoH-like ATPase